MRRDCRDRQAAHILARVPVLAPGRTDSATALSQHKTPAGEVAIPLFLNRRSIMPLIAEVAERQRSVLESGRYILGPEVEAFEAEFAAAAGVAHCVGVANGTDALTIALRALRVGDGDEVVVPASTFFATAESVVHAGARPVFCDIDPDTRCMSAQTASAVITNRTAALVPVHLFGHPAPMAELVDLATEKNLALVADAAQAAGARIDGRPAGAFGDVATFSFYPSKNLGAFGDAGAIVTDDAGIAEKARLLRAHGMSEPGIHSEVAYNSRLDELQAVGLRALLPHLGAWTARRRAGATLYADLGLGELVTLPLERPGDESAYHLYVVTSSARDRIAAGLAEAGVEARSYYEVPLNRQPALADYSTGELLEQAERLGSEGLALPIGPDLDEHSAALVVAAVRTALRSG